MTTRKARSPNLRAELRYLRDLIAPWKSFSGALTTAFAVLPISAGLSDALLPDRIGLLAPPLAIVLSVVLVLFLFFRYRNKNVEDLDRAATRLFAASIICIVIFVVGWLYFVIPVNEQWHVIGIELTQEAQQAVTKGSVANSAGAYLDRFGHFSEDRIWTLRPVSLSLLTFSFGLSFACLSGAFFLFR